MKIKENKKSYKWFLCGLILVVVLTISYRVSKANYRISNSIELTTGKVVSSPYDLNIIGLYIDGVEQEKETQIPIDGYRIDEVNSYCYKESKNNKYTNIKLHTDELGNHIFSGISKGSKCILYFNKVNENNCGTACQYILSNIDTINIRRKDYLPFNETVTGDNAPTERIMYEAPDDDGTSYYFSGNPVDNWVEFGGYYWRIIRINGDGSIRMIYQGTEKNQMDDNARISNQVFNNSKNNKIYAGYWYNEDGIDKPSNAYIVLNNWFNNSRLIEEQYFSKIDKNAGFCGDRTPSISSTEINGNIELQSERIYYGAYIRLRPGDYFTPIIKAIQPTYSCINSNDFYTYAEAKKGNKKLENPVGMITADEVAYAGMVFATSSPNNYLNINASYWTMSPLHYNITDIAMFLVDSVGGFAQVNNHVSFTGGGIRPVINLRSDVTFTGDGTIANPFKVN